MITPNARYVVFQSDASDLVAGDTNDEPDVFVRDRQTGTTERVNLSTGGAEANQRSQAGAISADGRFVVFTSRASNLAPDPSGSQSSIYVHDRQTDTTDRVPVPLGDGIPSLSADGRYIAAEDENGQVLVHDRQLATTEVASVDSSGDPAPGDHFGGVGSISANGRFVEFGSSAALVPGDTNGAQDAYVRDLQLDTTERVSVSDSGSQGNGDSQPGSISSDGRYVVFQSFASDLVAGDTNDARDVFLHDRQAGTTVRVSVGAAGVQGNDSSGTGDGPSISADGSVVSFHSNASNFDAGDTNGFQDIFVRDLQAGTTDWLTVAGDGTPADAFSGFSTISADGISVAFTSEASNLVPGDNPGLGDAFVFTRGAGGGGPDDDASATLPPGGGTVATNGEATPADPVGTSVTSPVGGAVSISEDDPTQAPPAGYTFLGQQVNITAPVASAANPLILAFLIDASLLSPGADASTLQAFRNGAPVANCTGPAGVASPNPCVSGREPLPGGDVKLTIRTSQASRWNFGVHRPYSFIGFFPPLANRPPGFNRVRAGSILPATFILPGAMGPGVVASGYPRSRRIDCRTGASLGPESPTAGKLIHTRFGLYSYLWKTSKEWYRAPDGPCRQLNVRLIDGTDHRVNVLFSR